MLIQQSKGFTITEIIVVVIIIGAMAGFAIPNYSKSLQRSHIQDATMQLSTLHAAQQIYRARSGRYWPLDAVTHSDLSEINDALNINIMANDMAYACVADVSGGVPTFDCSATPVGSGDYVISVNESSLSTGANPLCTGDDCPPS